MVRRVYAEKKPALRLEAQGLLTELRTILGVSSLTGLRLVNRYDVENMDAGVFQRAKTIVFSEPQTDLLYEEDCPLPEGSVERQAQAMIEQLARYGALEVVHDG